MANKKISELTTTAVLGIPPYSSVFSTISRTLLRVVFTSSMITQLAKGKTLEKAQKITRNDVAESLKGLPPIKMHCSNLASNALKKAIENYKNKSKNGK